MCGIAGKICFKGQIVRNNELTLISDILKKLHHRGPDDQGFYIDDKVWLVSTRLSIIDLSPAGRMPMKNEDESVWLMFNGEIYNYLELRKKLRKKHHFISDTDSEVLLHLYEDYGIDCLKYLRGMFAFAIWDKQKGQLFLARDRLGKKPLKYYFNSQFLIFASELKAFIDYPGVPREIDLEAIDQFISMEYVPSPKTGFKGIYKLPPASYILVDLKGNISCKKYWELSYGPKMSLSDEEWEERITDKLTEAVELRLRSDVSLGVHLSGGVDSGLITALASLNSKKRLSTFSVGFDDDQFNELPYAKMVAEKYQTDHHEIILEPESLKNLRELIYAYEEPFADSSILPTWFLMKECRKEITVALNGDGGDENFGGYERYQAMGAYQLIKSLPLKQPLGWGLELLYKLSKKRTIGKASKVLRFYEKNYPLFYSNLINSSDLVLKESLYSQNFKDQIKESYRENFLVRKFAELPGNINWLDKLLLLDVKTYLPDNLMTKVDIASMAHSLEVRSPFLDYEFMELVAKMPMDLKIKNLKTKYMLKKIAGRYLPEKCINRKKQGFVPPLEKWLRSDIKYLQTVLLDKEFLDRDFFNKETIEKMVHLDVVSSNRNTRIIWRLLCLKNWMSVWFN